MAVIEDDCYLLLYDCLSACIQAALWWISCLPVLSICVTAWCIKMPLTLNKRNLLIERSGWSITPQHVCMVNTHGAHAIHGLLCFGSLEIIFRRSDIWPCYNNRSRLAAVHQSQTQHLSSSVLTSALQPPLQSLAVLVICLFGGWKHLLESVQLIPSAGNAVTIVHSLFLVPLQF